MSFQAIFCSKTCGRPTTTPSFFLAARGLLSTGHDPWAHRVVREAAEQGKVVDVICLTTLASAGVLSGRKATVLSPEAKRLEAAGGLTISSLTVKMYLIN
ncbi:MAG: hypothetical protein H5U00_05560 [Clostridia bacterium]|nr:hypothetical protein [Clostridia bacterium]